MNKVARQMMVGMFLLSFHINFMGVPIVPGIVGCLVFCNGFRILEREGDGEGSERNRKMERTGKLWLGITTLGLILAVFTRQSIGISIQITAALMLVKTACGCSMLNHYGEFGRQYTQSYKKGPSSLGYPVWMTAGLAPYEYLVVSRSNGWDIAGAVCVITECIMLIKELAVWAPGEKIGYWRGDGRGERLYFPPPFIEPLEGVITSLFE